MRRQHRRENKALKMLIQATIGVVAYIVVLILFFAFIWWRGQHTYTEAMPPVAFTIPRLYQMPEE